MSEQKLVPELRFPEFEGEWEDKTLGDITRIIDCKHRTPPYVEVGIPVVSPGSIRWGALDLESPVKRVSNKEYQSLMDHCDPKAGDLVFSRNQSLGIASYVSTDSPFVLGQDTVLIQSARDSGFIYYWLQRQKVQNYITSLSGGSTFSRINLSDIRQLNIKIPTEDEQQKITDSLSSVDAKLAKLGRKKALLEDYKRGLMQQIFSQKLRFKQDDGSEFPEWKETVLGNLAKITTGSSNREDASDSAQYTFFDRSVDVRRSDKYLYDCTAIIVAGEGKDFVPRIFSGKFDLHQRAYAIMKFKGCIPEYIYRWLHFNRSHFLKFSVGSTMPSLRMESFTNFPVCLPCELEQQKVADFLSLFDQKINVVSKQIEQLETFKKGLLQKLFV